MATNESDPGFDARELLTSDPTEDTGLTAGVSNLIEGVRGLTAPPPPVRGETAGASQSLGGGGYSSDLTSLASELGIDVSGAASGGFASSSDYPVLTGKKATIERAFGETKIVGEETRLASDVLRDFYRLDPIELRNLKTRLFNAGFYPSGTSFSEVNNADYDDVSFAAYQRAVERAGKFFEAGRAVTFDEVLDTPSERVSAGVDTSGLSPLVKQELVQGVAVELLGRELPDVEAAQIAERLPGRQDEAAILAEREIESGEHATEAAGYDFVKRAQEFYSMLASPVPSPTPTRGRF